MTKDVVRECVFALDLHICDAGIDPRITVLGCIVFSRVIKNELPKEKMVRSELTREEMLQWHSQTGSPISANSSDRKLYVTASQWQLPS